MNIIFGVLNCSRKPVDECWLTRAARATEAYAPDGVSVRVDGAVGMGLQSHHTNQRSTLESQPVLGAHGNMLAFDGRLDNYRDLVKQLDMEDAEASEPRIVLAAFERWRSDCFSHFVGDWALSLWSHSDHALYLARDHAGTRTLYFEQTADHIFWSTYLETFFVDNSTRELDQEYAARYLASRPLRDRTPYREIRSVPPAHYLKLRDDSTACCAHWQWMIQDRILYHSDREYEAHFLELFGQSVARRTGPGAPILAELSGGVDSTSIVCMSDAQRGARGGDGSTDLLDTVSLYNDLEPSWDERPYFSIVEKRRGKVGTHVDTSQSFLTYDPPSLDWGAPLLPGSDGGMLKREAYFEKRLGHGYRVVLSGIGGDELLGGVPFALPELADLLIAGRLRALFRRSLDWCLIDRSPLLEMLSRTVQFVLRLYWHGSIGTQDIPSWITRDARGMCASHGLPSIEEERRVGRSPSTIENGLTWWFLLESLPHLFPSQLARREYRYPYLDRDLVDFLFRVPRHKLLNPGRRRTLMRSALREIVPSEILERKQKAYVIRKPLLSLEAEHEKIQALFAQPLLAEYGLIVPTRIRAAARSVAEGREPHLWKSLMRSISFELWLKAQSKHLSGSAPIL